VLDALTQPYNVSHPPSLLGASLGIATSAPGDTPASLLAAADAAMYEAKKAGGRRFSFATRT
jgi:PleD family two-component response regulator